MNIFLNEYFGFCFELNFELNHFSARFNEKINFQNVSNRASSMGSNTANVEKWEQAANNTITRSAGAPIRIHHTLSLPTVIIIIL